ncbi:MAG: helix-turn-helix transcriptional regulator [Lachnospiraceae bacterium]|nr:helix-turn-helix transcriptional regulator [Lachnospiraceae bacterium]
MDQAKIGAFLRELRKEKGKTQEEIAEQFGVSSRSVSRWENGNTMPDLGILVELADYYGRDIREIIDGERKSEKMENQNETLQMVADYAKKQKMQAIVRAVILFSLEMVMCGYTIGSAVLVLRSDGKISAGYAVIPMFFAFLFSVALIINAKDYVRKSTTQKKEQ